MSTAEEYLTIREVAALLKVSPKRVRNLMASRTFREGEHFFRPKGLGARFKKSALLSWIESKSEARADTDTVPLHDGVVLRIPAYGLQAQS